MSNKSKAENRAEKRYPGMATNQNDTENPTRKTVAADTCALNNNPRTNEKEARQADDPAIPADKL
ncbi:MAG: hypothetical protein K2L74_02995 [Muribaculaceae bacterium]|nr:hypothetical protein [Muribaculaceae bacterium]MDE6540960.1 hypothetical protein [Muribaculaceae bacterium]